MTSEELFVCTQCFTDEGIVEFITQNESGSECSFCMDSDEGTASMKLVEVAAHINECLYREYDDAANQLPYDGREGGYFGRHWDTHDLLFEEIELGLRDYGGDLAYELLRHLDDNTWCQADGLGTNDDEDAHYSWRDFSRAITHERRYFFSDFRPERSDPWDDTPGQFLDRIFQYAKHAGLFKSFGEGLSLFRARYEAGRSKFVTTQTLGPPPEKRATQANRMSPPGIVMFYACENEETAVLETASSFGRFAIAHFATLRPALILDLTAIPPVPSLFQVVPDSLEYWPRRVLKFLHHVAREMSQRIDRDDRVHIEYVPTQVVTEFVRSQPTIDRKRVDGIRYPSSVHPCHASFVLFATQDNVLPAENVQPHEDRWLELVGVRHVLASARLLECD